MKKPAQRSIKKSGGAKISGQKKSPGYWKNLENRERTLKAICTYLSKKPNATAEELARAVGYGRWSTIRKLMHLGKGERFRLGDLGKAQEAGKHGGFRRWRPPQERRTLYKRILQEIIRNPFLEYEELAKKMRVSVYAIGGTIVRMRNSGHMPPLFFETQRLKAVHRLIEQGLTQREVASRLGVTQQAVSKYVILLERINEFASERKKPVEWVINRYGMLVEAGILGKIDRNTGWVRTKRKTRRDAG